MNISYLIQMLQNKITILQNAKSQALSTGDLDQMNTIDKELLDTQNTFSQLTLLVDMAAAASSANATPAQVVATGLDVLQNAPPTTQGPSASAVIRGYDISAYATDPLYEAKIQNILDMLPVFVNAEELDAYIQTFAPGSPVRGVMVFASVTQYSVDQGLLVAIMQNDSQFGTLGVAVSTNNPGNVGNTGYATQTFPTWGDGVNAVASWLSDHRVR